MAQHRIFIAHTSENEEFARYLCDSLKNIVQFEPYLAQDYPSYGENFKDRIQYAIENCRFFIVLLDQSALGNQWVNQELGYACAVRKRKRGNYHIIPVSASSFHLKGMITRDSEDILFSDQVTREVLVANIIWALRTKVYGGLNYRTLQFSVTCHNCVDRVRLSSVYSVDLPQHEVIRRAFDQGLSRWETTCPNCGTINISDMHTWTGIPSQ